MIRALGWAGPLVGPWAGVQLASAAGLTAVLPAVWAGVVVAVRLRRRPPPARARLLAVPRARAVGRRRLGRPPEQFPARPARPARWAATWLRRRAAARRRTTAVEADLPEVVDLLRLAVGAGHTVPLALAAVTGHVDGPVGRGLADALAATTRGRRLADALDDLPAAVGEPVRPLAATLAGSLRYGHAIGPALERLAAECRADQRRRSEAAARRVPVLLLFPLVLCILPAFALLTVAPLLAGALRALRL